jgi:hypothetical protein
MFYSTICYHQPTNVNISSQDITQQSSSLMLQQAMNCLSSSLNPHRIKYGIQIIGSVRSRNNAYTVPVIQLHKINPLRIYSINNKCPSLDHYTQCNWPQTLHKIPHSGIITVKWWVPLLSHNRTLNRNFLPNTSLSVWPAYYAPWTCLDPLCLYDSSLSSSSWILIMIASRN